MRPGTNPAHGFTLLELMVALAVLAILVTLGVPSFAGLVRSTREANAYHLVTTSFAAARVAAVKHGVPVTVCPSNDGTTCRSDLVWEEGWILYRDPDRAQHPTSPDEVLQRLDGIGPGVTLRGTSGRMRVRFTPRGWAHGSNISLRLCETRHAQLLGRIVVNNGGRARTERSSEEVACPYAR